MTNRPRQVLKAGTNIVTGSAAVLLANILRERIPNVLQWDPYIDGGLGCLDFGPSVFVVATAHDNFFSMPLPGGSVVLDPWGRRMEQPGVETIKVGRR